MLSRMEFLDWKNVTSIVASIVFLRSIIREFIPPEIYQFLKLHFLKFFSTFQTNISIVIEEYDSSYANEIYDSVECYLSSKCLSSAKTLKLSKPKSSKNFTFIVDSNQKMEEIFDGIRIKWSLYTIEKNTNPNVRSQESRCFALSFDKKHMQHIQSKYLPHVMEEANRIQFMNREQKLYTNRSWLDGGHGRFWTSVPFTHPSNFDTLALDPAITEEIKADLTKFVKRREFYNRVGRSWKRGYLLYGPPGTGKTSLIAAIANFLQFDIYDLELTSVTCNSELRKLLIATSSRSVIVVEDVDCTLDLSDRKKGVVKKEEGGKEGDEEKEKKQKGGEKKNDISTVSLSGVLNFVDGLWSSCGGERLMIFTTNHIEKLDPALLRAGRMDKHIPLGFCGFKAFETLAMNYLGVDEHELMAEVEEVLPMAEITPADVAEVFMSCNDDVEVGMRNVLEEMKKRAETAAEKKKMEVEGMEKQMVVAEDAAGTVEEKLETKEEEIIEDEQKM